MVLHVCGDPLSRYTCRATCVAADFLGILRLFRCSDSIALHPPWKALSRPPPFNCQRCRTSSCHWKGVALQGSVATTLAGVALHCATKESTSDQLGPTKIGPAILPTMFCTPEWWSGEWATMCWKLPLYSRGCEYRCHMHPVSPNSLKSGFLKWGRLTQMIWGNKFGYYCTSIT